jgi:hypothetical protein
MTGEDDKRKSARRRTLKGAIIAYNDRHSTVACTVRDISQTGARLRLIGAISVPETFELLVELDGFEAGCEVVRRRGDEIAVRFTFTRTVAPKRVQIVTPLVPEKAPSLRKKSNPPGRP